MCWLQAERWGSELLTEDVEHVDLSVRPFAIRTSETEVQFLLPVQSWQHLHDDHCAGLCFEHTCIEHYQVELCSDC